MIRVVHLGSLSWFFTHPGSRIQWSKRHRIPDSDPQHWMPQWNAVDLLILAFFPYILNTNIERRQFRFRRDGLTRMLVSGFTLMPESWCKQGKSGPVKLFLPFWSGIRSFEINCVQCGKNLIFAGKRWRSGRRGRLTTASASRSQRIPSFWPGKWIHASVLIRLPLTAEIFRSRIVHCTLVQ